jgi:elongation factor P hydroxylase
MSHDAKELEGLFEACFLDEFETRLDGGAPEPVYLPSSKPSARPHRILYREDFFASALHEIAHWCLAGAARRKLEDYGYWYAEDGRSAAQQSDFEAVETRPQAVEWILSDACGFDFHLSADNLEAGRGTSTRFEEAVRREKRRFLELGLPNRAETFRAALATRLGPVLATRLGPAIAPVGRAESALPRNRG